MSEPVMDNSQVVEGQVAPEGNEVEATPAVETPTPSWKDSLSDEFRSDPSLEKFKDINSMFKSYKHLESKLGKDKVIIPTEESSAEEIADFRNAMGVPESADKYELELPDNTDFQDTSLEAFKAKAHELNLPNSALQSMLNLQAELINAENERYQEEMAIKSEQANMELKKKYGVTFDKKINSVHNLIGKYFNSQEAKDALLPIANDPSVVDGFIRLVGDMGNDTFTQGNESPLMSPNQAKSEIAKIKQGDAYWDSGHPEHKETMQRVRELSAMSG